MKRLLLFLLILLSLCATIPTAPLPSTAGWFELLNTKIRSVGPPNNYLNSGYNFDDLLYAHLDAWSSGAFDTQRNRMVTFGGGHQNYSGNELYAIDIVNGTISRIIGPDVPVASGTCPEALAGGTHPNSRHTYGSIVYMANIDSLFLIGGSLTDCGGASNSVWEYHFASNTWEKRNYAGSQVRFDYGIAAAYDSNTGRVYVHDNAGLYYYTHSTNTMTFVGGSGIAFNYPEAIINTFTNHLVITGMGSLVWYDISAGSNFSQHTQATTGSSGIISSPGPGLAYDSVAHQIVAWNEGNTIYTLNETTWVWTPTTFANGPPPRKSTSVGTYGRWAYSPSQDVFVEVNNVDSNAYVLRTRSGTPPPPDTTPPSTPSSLSATAASSSQINLAWTASTDNVGVTGYNIYRCAGAGCQPSGTALATSIPSSYADNSVSSSTVYVYNVRAFDGAGNVSTVSSNATATTPAGPTITHIDFNFSSSAVMQATGWDFIAKTAAGGTRDTEQTGALAINYDQTLHPGTIRIPLGVGELWQGGNNSQNMLFKNLPADWSSIRLKIATFNPAADFQQVGILAYQNDDNYLDVERNYNSGSGGQKVGFFDETNQSTNKTADVALAGSGPLWLRLDRTTTDVFSAYYSTDGSTWISLSGAPSHPLVNPRIALQIGANTAGGTPTADLAWVEILQGGVVTPPIPPPIPASIFMTTLQNERDTYTRWGWTWPQSVEPNYQSAGGYSVTDPDNHGETEGDDLWTYLMMYLRTNQTGYQQRMNAWATYQKTRYRQCLGSSTNTYCYDRDSFIMDHLYGYGMIELFNTSNDTTALNQAKLLADDSINYWSHRSNNTWPVPGQFGMSFYSLRQGARALRLATYVARVTQLPQYIDLRNRLIDLWMQSTDWDSRGMYFLGDQQTDQNLGTGAWAAGGRITPPFQVGILAESFWQAYVDTQRDDIKQKLIAMARYMNQYGLNPIYNYSSSEIGWFNGQPYWNYFQGCGTTCTFVDPFMTTGLTNLLVFGYKLTGDVTLLNQAKNIFNRGTKGVYGSITQREVGDTVVGHFVDTLFDTSTGNFYLYDNKGELQYTYMLFENGGLPTVLAPTGVTHYISPTGTDTGTGLTACTNAAAPCRTFAYALNSTRFTGGDTLDLRVGTYNDVIQAGGIPSGTSDTVRTIIQSFPGETATIQPAAGNANGDVVSLVNQQYITFRNLVINGVNITNFLIGVALNSHHIRVEGNNLNGPDAAVNASRDQTSDRHHIDVVNNTITLMALGNPGFVHAIYMRGTHDCTLDGNSISNAMGYGIFLAKYQNGALPITQFNIIRNNQIFNNGSRGIDIEGGDRIQVYNNLVYNNNIAPDSVAGIFLSATAPGVTNSLVANNTVYGNKGQGIWMQSGGTFTQTQVKNNILFANTASPLLNDPGAGCPTCLSNNLTANPLFVGGIDFHLQAGSPAINAGTSLASFFTTDFDGTTRPVGTAWDIGGYEFGGTTAPAPPTGFHPVNP